MLPTRLLPPVVRTARLVLRRQRPEDAPLIKEAVDTSLAHLLASVAWAQAEPTPLPVLAERLAGSAAAFDAGDAWALTVLDAAETRALGGVGLEPAESPLAALVGPNAVEGGYWLRADATGHGYATEAIAALAELAFGRLGARRVELRCDARNEPSRRVAERVGFVLEGRLRSAFLDPGGQPADELVFALIPDDALLRPA